MCTAQLLVRAKVGLHARPAATFVKTAGAFRCNIDVRNVTTHIGPVNAKSILNVLSLGVEQNHTIEVITSGSDEAEAVAALRRLVESNFGEA
jgi:phosphotransferase system HPr (HPr) family protein